MKKLKLILLGLILVGCSAEDIQEEECRCTKTTYTFETIVTTGFDGLPVLNFVEVFISEENVLCNEEVEDVENGDGTLHRIECE